MIKIQYKSAENRFISENISYGEEVPQNQLNGRDDKIYYGVYHPKRQKLRAVFNYNDPAAFITNHSFT